MTYAQVLALIQQFIVANGNNEITANVLRPILEDILTQPNEKMGDLIDLQTTDQSNLVAAINEALSLITPTIGSYNTKIHPLSLFGIDPDLPELTKIAEAVKLHGPFTCDAGQQMVFRTVSTVGTQENGSIVTRHYRLLRNMTTIGGASSSHVYIPPTWFMPDGVSEYSNPDAAGTIIELGDIGTSEVWDVFNLGDNGEAWDMNEYRFVRATQNSEVMFWAFTGQERFYGGSDMNVEPDIFEAFENDFFLLTDQPEEPDPFDPSNYDLDDFNNASADPFVRDSEIPAQVDLSTGLEAIDEGNGIGWRLKGTNPDNYGNIGSGAIDLGASAYISTTVGATGSNSTVGGGGANIASGNQSTVGGGSQNKANGQYSTVDGGIQNTANGSYSTVGGGYLNTISGDGSVVGGGFLNEASDLNATVGGGSLNKASGDSSTVGGGYNNEASDYSTVGGGEYNKASGDGSTVGGGTLNEASGVYSTVLGGILNFAKSFGEVLGGLYATIKEGNATTWIGTDRIFGIGNGKSTSERSDAFNVYKNGLAELPSVTNALIDAAGPKTIPTKEYLHRKQIKTVPETTYTLLESDWNKILHFTSATDVTITVPTGLTVGNRYEGKQRGTGQLIFVDDGTTVINVGASETNKTLEQFSVFGLDCVSADEYDLFGKLELI